FNVKGYGLIRNIKVQEGIQLGTTDRPIISAGDIATIAERPRDRKWICSAIHSKVKCATGTLGIDPSVEVEMAEYSNSYTVQELGSLETPFDLRIPPFELLGQITLPDFRFPDTTTYLCGLPPCTECGTPSLGKA